MMKDKNHSELLELVYSLTRETETLNKELNSFYNLIDSLEKWVFFSPYNIFYLILRPLFMMDILIQNKAIFTNYKINNMNFTNESEVLESLAKCIRFENKKIDHLEYKNHMVKMGIIDACATCSNSLMQRLHNQFQKKLSHEIKTNYPHLAMSIKFTSKRFSGDFFEKNIPFWTFHELYNHENLMLTEQRNYAAVGRPDIAEAVSKDLKVFKTYLQKRKAIEATEENKTPKGTETPKVDPVEESATNSPEKKENASTEITEEQINKVIELLKSGNLSQAKISEQVGVSKSKVSRINKTLQS